MPWFKLTTRHYGALTRVTAIEAENFDEACKKAWDMIDHDTTGRVRKRPLTSLEMLEFEGDLAP